MKWDILAPSVMNRGSAPKGEVWALRLTSRAGLRCPVVMSTLHWWVELPVWLDGPNTWLACGRMDPSCRPMILEVFMCLTNQELLCRIYRRVLVSIRQNFGKSSVSCIHVNPSEECVPEYSLRVRSDVADGHLIHQIMMWTSGISKLLFKRKYFIQRNWIKSFSHCFWVMCSFPLRSQLHHPTLQGLGGEEKAVRAGSRFTLGCAELQ